MAQYTEKPLFIRADKKTRENLAFLKRLGGADVSEAEIVRQALQEKVERSTKPNGHRKPNGRKKGITSWSVPL